MIFVITGKIGGGKTLLANTMAVDKLGRGGCVVANIAYNHEAVDRYLRKHKRRRLVEGQLRFHDYETEPEFQKVVPFGVPEEPVLVIVDEAQLFYNQADATQMAKMYKKLLSFLTQSRKCNVDVVFITQYDTTIWAQFRHQVLFGYACRDMRAVTLPLIGKLPALGLCWSKYDVQSGEIMERGRTPLKKELFELYDTRQMYDSQMRELQEAAEIWKPVNNRKSGVKDEIDSDSGRGSWWLRLLRGKDGGLVRGT